MIEGSAQPTIHGSIETLPCRRAREKTCINDIGKGYPPVPVQMAVEFEAPPARHCGLEREALNCVLRNFARRSFAFCRHPLTQPQQPIHRHAQCHGLALLILIDQPLIGRVVHVLGFPPARSLKYAGGAIAGGRAACPRYAVPRSACSRFWVDRPADDSGGRQRLRRLTLTQS